MYRLEIHWTFQSPFLQIISGILFIHKVTDGKFVQFAKYNVKKERGVLSFETQSHHDDFTMEIYNKLKDPIETMVESYYRGMLMDKRDFHWVDENGNGIYKIDVTFNKKKRMKVCNKDLKIV